MQRAQTRFFDIQQRRLEVTQLSPDGDENRSVESAKLSSDGDAAPTLVFLHEGLGSISLWRDFPQRVVAATGCSAVVYSRYGYGNSAVLQSAHGVDYMHREAREALPELLDKLGIERPVLIGHSDGASIAIIHAGSGFSVRGVVLLAPHVFVEDISIASIAQANVAFETTDLPSKLARHHADATKTFYGWNDVWLHPDFRSWNIERFLPSIRCPVLAIQGSDDEYGTMAQLEAIGAQVGGPCELVELADCKHSPHRDQPEKTLAAITRFVAELRQGEPIR